MSVTAGFTGRLFCKHTTLQGERLSVLPPQAVGCTLCWAFFDAIIARENCLIIPKTQNLPMGFLFLIFTLLLQENHT